ncbi:MAG TPA: hypothetical protein VEY12_09970 [Thermoplasmata archaeon]|nr:hypothetical protein [Thermoplasmata archaeon]
MKVTAILGLLGGGYFVGAALYAVARGHALSGPDLVLAALGALIVIGSVRILLPSYDRRWRQRFARLESMSEEERRARNLQAARRGRLVLLAAFLIEIPVGVVFWSRTEWDEWIAAMLGTTVLFLLLFVLLVRKAKPGLRTAGRP